MKKGNRFYNPNIDDEKRTILDVIKWQLGFYNDYRKPRKIPIDFKYPNLKRKTQKKFPKVTWINHCTFLISIDKLNILTDPIWSDRCSPFSFFGPKRCHKVPIKLENLPRIDLILISHDHYDHLDKKTVRKLFNINPFITWVVPKSLKKWFNKQGIVQVIEMDWWEETQIGINGQKIGIHAVPTQHFSGRGLFDKNRTQWVGYVVDFFRHKKPKKRLYFVGDTGYNRKDFKKIGKRFKKMDLSLIPIGTYVPRAFMDPVHIDPNKSSLIHREVGSKKSIGMHWKTFRLSGESLDQPPYDLYCSLERKGIDPKTFRILDPGQTINW